MILSLSEGPVWFFSVFVLVSSYLSDCCDHVGGRFSSLITLSTGALQGFIFLLRSQSVSTPVITYMKVRDILILFFFDFFPLFLVLTLFFSSSLKYLECKRFHSASEQLCQALIPSTLQHPSPPPHHPSTQPHTHSPFHNKSTVLN